MKERATTLVLAIGSFVLFYALLFPKPAPDREDQDLPLSTETRGHGYQALWRWLKGEGVQVSALRQPYSELSKLFVGPGDVLIATVPAKVPPRRYELKDLDAWVVRGNTLLVMAALDDTPPWALGADAGFLKSLERMTMLRFEVIPEPQDKSAASKKKGLFSAKDVIQPLLRTKEPERTLIGARGTEPLFETVQSVLAESEFPASRWKAVSVDTSAVLEIGERSLPSREPAVWLKRRGEGQIIVVAFASIFSNKLIGEQDNARLFANIIAWSRTPDGRVIFDDDHQGAVDYYDSQAFFHDPRLHRTLLWIILGWFLFVLGWQRLRASTDGWNPIDVTHFIDTTSGFFASALAPAAAGARLLENFFNTIRRRVALREDGQPVWEWLAADARTRAEDLDELKKFHAKAQSGTRVDLVKLQNLTSRILGNLE